MELEVMSSKKTEKGKENAMFSSIMARTSLKINDDDVYFLLGQQDELFYSAIPLTNHYTIMQ